MRINFNFLEIEAFLCVAETGSFQQAAGQLSVSQSAITRRIQKLEEALGTTLFERTTRSLKLTPQARGFLPRAQDLLAGADEAVRSLKDESLQFEHQRNALITVAAIPTTTQQVIPAAIKAFLAQGQQARFRILDSFANDVLEAVSNGDVDFGITLVGLQEPGLTFDRLFEDPFVLAMPRTHPLADKKRIRWPALSGHNVIIPWKGTGNRLLLDSEMARQRLQIEWSCQVQHSSTAIGLVGAGLGVALLPASAIPASTKKYAPESEIVARPLGNPQLSRTIGIVRRINQALSPSAQLFYETLMQQWRKPGGRQRKG